MKLSYLLGFLAAATPLVIARQACGGLKGTPCPPGYICVDNPHDSCDPKKGGADCIGYCVKKPQPERISCGGLSLQKCPARAPKCIDNPYDDCHPKHGGFDCPGVCVEEDGPTICGTRGGSVCKKHFECYTRTPGCEKFDCGGICVAVK